MLFRSNALANCGQAHVPAGQLRRRLARCLALLSLCGALFGCGAKAAEPGVDGQSHWWRTCSSNLLCGEGFQCACGICTKTCSNDDACDGTKGARCEQRAGLCGEEDGVAEALVCQVACEAPADCPSGLTCQAGVCGNAHGLDAAVAPDAAAGDAARAESALSDAALPQSAPSAPTLPDSAAGDTALVESAPRDAGLPQSAPGADVGTVIDGGVLSLCGASGPECPLPPPEWCTYREDSALLPELVAYWSSFCEAGADPGAAAMCGDGILQAPEVCDDGNNVSGDGCVPTCSAVETDFRCSTPGAPCEAL